MGMTSHKGDESWSNLQFLLIQETCKGIKFQKYILCVRILLVFSGTGIKTFQDTVQSSEEKAGKVIKFLFIVGFHLQ